MKHSLHLYGTLGPACASEETIRRMFLAGMTGIRLNLSHMGLAEGEEWLSMYHNVSKQMRILPELLVDLQGPELRIGKLPAPMILSKGDKVFLTSETDKEGFNIIPCPKVLFGYLKKNQILFLNDGKITLRVSEALERNVFSAEVMHGGELSSEKSIAIEGVSIPLPTLTEKDKENLKLLRSYQVTGVMLSFVKSPEDLIALRKELAKNDMDYVRIFAKIESMEGVEHLPSLLPYCDEIIIARGDLGNTIPLPKLPGIQKRIAMTCERMRKPYMVVTQLLASMEQNPVPTRAEVMDIFQAVLDGASSLMLTGETAVGKYPAEAMSILSGTVLEAQRFKTQI